MDLAELKEALSSNEVSKGYLSASEIKDIINKVRLDMKIDPISLEYFYEIDVEEVLASDMGEDSLEALRKEGWSFSKDGTKLILYFS